MHLKELFYFGLEAVLFLLIFSLELFIAGFLLNWLSAKFREKISSTIGVKAFVLILAPGIMIHEISHLLTALFFLYRIEDVKLFDYKAQNGAHGHVISSRRSMPPVFLPQLWQSMGSLFIGVAPLVVGPALLGVAGYYLIPGAKLFVQHPSLHTLPHLTWQAILWLYLLFATLANIELSSADLKETWTGFAYVVLCTFLLALTSALISPHLMHSGLPKKYWASIGLENLPVIKARK